MGSARFVVTSSLAGMLAGCSPYQVGQWELTTLTTNETKVTVQSAEGILRVDKDFYADMTLNWSLLPHREEEPVSHHLKGEGVAIERFGDISIDLAGDYAKGRNDGFTATVEMDCARRRPKGLKCHAAVTAVGLADTGMWSDPVDPLSQFALDLTFEPK